LKQDEVLSQLAPELQNYFRSVVDKKLKVSLKPQNIYKIQEVFRARQASFWRKATSGRWRLTPSACSSSRKYWASAHTNFLAGSCRGLPLRQPIAGKPTFTISTSLAAYL